MCDHRISVCARHLKGAVRQVDVDVSSQVLPEIIFLFLSFEAGQVLLQAWEGKKFNFGFCRVLLDNNRLLDNFGDVFFTNAA